MTQNESFLDLIGQANAMLADRHPLEQELIYYIAKLPSEERMAIVIAYQNLHPQDEECQN